MGGDMTLYFYFLSKDGITMEQSEVEEIEVQYSDNLYMLSSKLKNFRNDGIAVHDVGMVIQIDAWTEMIALINENMERAKTMFCLYFANENEKYNRIIDSLNREKDRLKERMKMAEKFVEKKESEN